MQIKRLNFIISLLFLINSTLLAEVWKPQAVPNTSRLELAAVRQVVLPARGFGEVTSGCRGFTGGLGRAGVGFERA
jgi:hypothetical protein